ncbi:MULTISPECIES: DNA primase [unclassified Aminobacter]|uniref:DNA primase n=1 Tax=unclassified Aminobacter TaxID=2644704 RepID=UPI000463FF80|nr:MULTISPECIES: DNA primase [unclassified Aminobacter]TWH27105.1 DNA primase [Aminobacter sp. J15]
MRFPQSFLDEIRDRVPISAVVGTRVTWDRRKTNVQRGDYWACCPFHGEKSPSFHCEDRKGRYHCFGCGVTGDHFKFLTELDGMAFPEAVERLAEMAGVAMPARDAQAERRERERATLTDVMELATRFFQEKLHAAEGAKARAYLRERGLSSATQQTFRLGYAPDSRNALKEYLASKGVAREQIEAVGLVVHGPDIPVSYDRFRDRVMFPIEDSRGRVIAFGGRALSNDVPAKYLNSNDTELFHKGNVLYNFARARKAQVKAGTVIAVEGYMDVIALAQAGFEHVVAPLGTALTENQLELLWRMTGEPILCFDGDQAGLKAAWRAADLALPLIEPGKTLRFALLPEGQDPDDLVRSGGPDAFRSVLNEARPLAELLWLRETSGGVFDTPERRAELEKNLRELTGRIKDESVRRHYQQDMRDRVQSFFGPRDRGPQKSRFGGERGFGGGRGGKQGQIAAGRIAVSESLARSALVRASGGTLPLRETAMIVSMINHPELIDEHFEEFADMDLPHPELRKLHSAVLDALANGVDHERKALIAALAAAGHEASWERAVALVRKARIWPALEDAAIEDAREAFSQAAALQTKARELKRQRASVQQALADAVEKGEEQTSQHLLQVLNTISLDIANLERLEALVDGFGVQSGRG